MSDVQLDLRETLDRIAEIERTHNVRGVSFTVKPGEQVSTEESAGYVLSFLTTSIELLSHIESLPEPEPTPAELQT